MITKIANHIIDFNCDEYHMKINVFDWVPGVGLYGIFKAYKKTNQNKYIDFLTDWADKHLMEAYDRKTVNSTCPLLTVLELYKLNKNNKYLKVCIDIAEWIVTSAPLTREGGLEHTVIDDVAGFTEQIWADTLFMVCIFLSKLGMLTENRIYTDFAVNQLKIHHKLLFDDESFLYYHGWNCSEKNHMSSIHWGRANAWIIYSTMEIINTIGDFDGCEEIYDYIRKHASSLKKVQRNNGGFGTILNDTTSYNETSATSGIIAGIKMAVKKGILDSSYLTVCEKGINYIEKAVLEDGAVNGVSGGTPVMNDAEAYRNIPVVTTLYGQSLAVLALVE